MVVSSEEGQAIVGIECLRASSGATMYRSPRCAKVKKESVSFGREARSVEGLVTEVWAVVLALFLPPFHLLDPSNALVVARHPELECRRCRYIDLLLPRIATTRSEEHTSELQSLRRISYAVFCLK